MVKGITGMNTDTTALTASAQNVNAAGGVNNAETAKKATDGSRVENSLAESSAGIEQQDSQGKAAGKTELSEETVSQLTDALNTFVAQDNRDIEFDYCKELERMTMRVVNKENGDVIKEFPPEEMLDALKGIREWIGVLLDKKA